MLKIINMLLSAVLFFILLCCCSHKAERTPYGKGNRENATITEYCASLDYTDTASLHNDKKMSYVVTDLVRLMLQADSVKASKGLKTFFKGLNGDTLSLRNAAHYAEVFLNDPESPVRNENLYILFLKALLTSDNIPEEIELRERENLRKVSLNRPGDKAADFQYLSRDGKLYSLYDTPGDRIMVVFYDPECENCQRILHTIASDPEINHALTVGQLTVLAIYTEGKKDVWEEDKTNLPSEWIVGYDVTCILDKELYHLPAMPTIYLLDNDKRVIVKDLEIY